LLVEDSRVEVLTQQPLMNLLLRFAVASAAGIHLDLPARGQVMPPRIEARRTTHCTQDTEC
jgi:hypothetical protein